MNRIKTVSSIVEICAVPFSPDVNLLAYPQALKGDFEGAAARIFAATSLRRDAEWVTDVLADCSIAVQDAGARIASDLRVLDALNRRAELRVQRQDNAFLTLFHHDVAKNSAQGRILCCYAGAGTEILENEDAEPRVFGTHPAMYVAKPGAKPFVFPLGTMWRHAAGNDPDGALPCVHRAPACNGGLRLLMIA